MGTGRRRLGNGKEIARIERGIFGERVACHCGQNKHPSRPASKRRLIRVALPPRLLRLFAEASISLCGGELRPNRQSELHQEIGQRRIIVIGPGRVGRRGRLEALQAELEDGDGSTPAVVKDKAVMRHVTRCEGMGRRASIDQSEKPFRLRGSQRSPGRVGDRGIEFSIFEQPAIVLGIRVVKIGPDLRVFQPGPFRRRKYGRKAGDQRENEQSVHGKLWSRDAAQTSATGFRRYSGIPQIRGDAISRLLPAGSRK